ncbi:energy-coupling factor transport system permease protein [Weissella beninensis]|uniref:Energy-coupling factor transporter transmembrane protein EcfT n=1 Tax=Periweissella beninensis TaxID=504936 RepID=A0ABT0VIL9_9LACO|nr:energy-coupling factor transporter transmembrane component T [Periweissella beninensis]MBM7543950.1 energy-coupling factor transport system permease protein [Periweissella beninensis]MCM2437676.1 energy-coupling factor transporter transmembrane protein EcfT [Periweissella beninensis]
MNASVKLGIVLLLSLEISFTKSISLNCLLVISSLIYLLGKKINLKNFIYTACIPLLPAFGSWSSIYFYGTGDNHHMAWVMFSRIFAYVWLGATLTLTTHIDEILKALEQNVKLPNTFVYGMLAAFNFIPKIGQEIKTIKIAAQMRGVTLHFWSPQIFFKAILTSLRWSNNLAQAMTSHGFSEGAPRTYYQVMPIPTWNMGVALCIILIVQLYLMYPLWP